MHRSSAVAYPSSAAQIPHDSAPMPRRKPALRTLSDLDGRTRGGKRAAELMAMLTGELGGQLTDLQRMQVERAAALAALSEDLAARKLGGEDVDLAEIVRLSNLLQRSLRALGIKPGAAKPRGLSLQEYLAQRAEKAAGEGPGGGA